jgi:hypothetical protein
VHSPIGQRPPGHCYLRCGGFEDGQTDAWAMRRNTVSGAVLFLLVAVSTRVAEALGIGGPPTPMRLQRIMLVQAARADPVSVGHARPLALNPSYNTGESLEGAAPRQRRRPLSAH